ncbi:MAG: PIN/TRAM domain-containing protein [Verrucomicrobiales bacterium]
MNTPFSIGFARAFLLVICCLIGMSIDMGLRGGWWLGGVFGFLFGAIIIVIEVAIKDFSFRGFSSATIGLLVGILCANLITRIDFFSTPWMREFRDPAQPIFNLCLYTGLGFLGMMLALRSNREEFSFIIPYVRFRRESVQDQPILVDTNVVIDGRIPRLCATGFLGGELVVPRFVLDELHTLADSRDDVKKERGRRGLDCLNRMKQTPGLEVSVHEAYQESSEPVDTKLIQLGRLLGARILTNDATLGKIARLQGVAVLSLTELSKAMRPVVVAGDEIELALVKEGKDRHQAVGYLPDGTMLVVNQAADRIGTTQSITVGGTLQTSAGRLIFAELTEQLAKTPAESGAENS